MPNADAVAAVVANFGVWEAVPTATIRFANAGSLPVDVTVDNYLDYFDTCGDGLNPVIFDADGSITDDVFGPGASEETLGFAGVDCGTFMPPVITDGVAVLNGKFVDGIDSASNPEESLSDFYGVFIHEFGHYINLDHSQVNLVEGLIGSIVGEVPNPDTVATMFPFFIDGAVAGTLHLDDIVSVSMLYPEPIFVTGFGEITGTVFRSNGTTPFQGAYVIARQVGDPRVSAVGVASGTRYFPGNAGGPPPPALEGFYEIPGLPAGSYTVEIEEIASLFTGGSSVGPLDPPAALPGLEEFYNGANEAGTNPPDNPASAVPIAVTAGGTQSGIDVIINALPPASNDACAAARVISDFPYRDVVDTSSATTAATDPLQSCTSGGPSRNSNSVWYRLTAAADLTVVADTRRSDYDTVLTAYAGSCTSLTEAACSDDVFDLPGSEVVFQVAAGQTALLEMTDSDDAPGGGRLDFRVNAFPEPANDECTSATVIPALPYTDTVDTRGATTGPGDPSQSCDFGSAGAAKSVWYTVTVPEDGVLVADTRGSDYLTVLSAYTGSCGALTEVACDATVSSIGVPVTAGQTLLLEVSEYFISRARGGELVLNVRIGCSAAPLAGCRQPVVSGKALLKLRDKSVDSGDVLMWKWLAGELTDELDFGYPPAFASYLLCLYDEMDGLTTLRLSARALAGPEWEETARGYRYESPSAAPDGLQRIDLRAAPAGKAKILVKGKGENLSMPTLPLEQASKVVVQLVSTGGECWEATYSAPAIKNQADQFFDKAD